MITKIHGSTIVVNGSTAPMTVHTMLGEFEVPGKRISFNVRPRGNDEFDEDFGKELAKKKFNIASTDERIAQHMTMAKWLRGFAKNLTDIADKEEHIADEMCGKLEDMKCERDYFIENHFENK